MGMELMNSQAGFGTFVGSILFFGVVTSVGIGIGGLITTNSTDTMPVAVIMVILIFYFVTYFKIFLLCLLGSGGRNLGIRRVLWNFK
jgi:hypothetical protein